MVAAWTPSCQQVMLDGGGKSPQTIFEDCAESAQRGAAIATPSFAMCGQICGARARLRVHASIAEAVLDRVRQATAEAFTIGDPLDMAVRSEEHTSELQSLMRISYAVFCLKKKKKNNKRTS